MNTNGDIIRTLSNKDIAKFIQYFCNTIYECGMDKITCLPDKCIIYKICTREAMWIEEPYDKKLFKKMLDKELNK